MKGRNFRNSGEDDYGSPADPNRLNNNQPDEGDKGKYLYIDWNKERICYPEVTRPFKFHRNSPYKNDFNHDILEDFSGDIYCDILEMAKIAKIVVTNKILKEEVHPIAHHFCCVRYKSKENMEKFFNKHNFSPIQRMALTAARKSLKKAERGTRPGPGRVAAVDTRMVPTKPPILEECYLPYEENGVNQQEDAVIDLIDKRRRIERVLKESKNPKLIK